MDAKRFLFSQADSYFCKQSLALLVEVGDQALICILTCKGIKIIFVGEPVRVFYFGGEEAMQLRGGKVTSCSVRGDLCECLCFLRYSEMYSKLVMGGIFPCSKALSCGINWERCS